jgi:protein involved in polysaccharide export with SLBB domain
MTLSHLVNGAAVARRPVRVWAWLAASVLACGMVSSAWAQVPNNRSSATDDTANASASGAAVSGGAGAAPAGASTFTQPVIRATPMTVSPAQGSGATDDPRAAANNAANGVNANNNAQPGQPGMPLPLRPLPPNDFQRFAEESTGQKLPLFGVSLFEQASSAYVPSANVPVAPDYKLGVGDELMIRGWGSIVVDLQATIDRNGQIHIPRVGPVTMAGVQSAQAEAVVRTAIARYYKDFQLSVTPGRLRGINVYVVGQARKPGAYSLPSTGTLISALFASGGPNQGGSMRHIQVKRGGQQITELDLYAFLSKGDKSADVRLQDGDTIVIPAAAGFVALAGRVANAAVYELSGNQDTVGALLDVAGGVPVVADPTRVQLERIDPTRRPSRSVELLALDAAGKARTLRSGDVLTVAPLVTDFGKTVTLRGNVSQPIRSPWQQGMTIRDLIPGRAYLMSRASVKRQNKVFQADSDDAGSGSRLSGDALAQQIGDLVDEVNFDYAVIERVDADKLVVNLHPFNLGAALDDAASPDNLALQPGDVVTVFSVKDVQVPQAKRQVFVRVEGEVMRPGVYQMIKGETLDQLVAKAGGPTPDAFMFGAAFYREAVKKAQTDSLKQLVRKLESQVESRLSSAAASVTSTDATAQVRVQAEAQAQKAALDRLRNFQPNGRVMLGLQASLSDRQRLPSLRLEPQDRLVVPARPDFVSVLGSVNTETALIWQPGKTVQDYLEHSGVTSGADQDEIFVIRADGSVLSDAGSWFGRVKRADALPGDVIVLPEKTDHESAWSAFTRNAKDITQIVYQFSLGAAAIKTLRQ